ncbi:MAG: ATP-binding protein [Methylovulum sp.]|nr:ATP-binding protein [Methylovulum sp.]
MSAGSGNLNLLSNANRYTQGGSITLNCASAAVDRCSVPDSDHCRLTFIVSDTGQGIAEEEQKRIFEPFVRGTAGKSSGIDGVGMGLVIAQQWVNLMGGEIRVDSKPGHGSRFFFSIVCELVEAVHPLATLPEHAVALEPRVILVVEDDEKSRNLLAMLLEDYGFNVVTAKSGNDARQFLDGHAIDLVVTDQFMPDGDGWSVLMEWSARNIPLILLSATPPERPENLPETHRFADIQLKPLDANRLLTAIGEILAVKWTVTKAKAHEEEAETIHRPPMELLVPLKAMIEQGAVTDITEWLEIFSAQYPQYSAYAARIATANLTLDFNALRRLTA